MPQPNIDALTRVHKELVYQNGKLHGEAHIPEEYLEQDIAFTLRNNIPAENTASRFETYVPRTESQADLLDKALFLSRARGRFMGLFALGGAGVGKSHVAIGLAKRLEVNGQTSRYLHVPSNGLDLRGGEPKHDETIIVDDLNGPFGWGRQNFGKIITRMHHNGSGRLFITSNVSPQDYNKFMVSMIGGLGENDPEIIRISDRAGVALRQVVVSGESFRGSVSEDPWADYSPGVNLPQLESGK